jgi:hypothetical protein
VCKYKSKGGCEWKHGYAALGRVHMHVLILAREDTDLAAASITSKDEDALLKLDQGGCEMCPRLRLGSLNLDLLPFLLLHV